MRQVLHYYRGRSSNIEGFLGFEVVAKELFDFNATSATDIAKGISATWYVNSDSALCQEGVTFLTTFSDNLTGSGYSIADPSINLPALSSTIVQALGMRTKSENIFGSCPASDHAPVFNVPAASKTTILILSTRLSRNG